MVLSYTGFSGNEGAGGSELHRFGSEDPSLLSPEAARDPQMKRTMASLDPPPRKPLFGRRKKEKKSTDEQRRAPQKIELLKGDVRAVLGCDSKRQLLGVTVA